MFRFCLSLLLALTLHGTVLAQTPSEPATSTAPTPQTEPENPLGAGLAAPTVAVLGVLAVLLGTTVAQSCSFDTSCGGGPPITATTTGTR